MIEHTTAPTAATTQMHRVKCHTGRPKTISNVLPSQGFTSWCAQCKLVHLNTWDSLPTPVLLGIQEALAAIVVARAAPEV